MNSDNGSQSSHVDLMKEMEQIIDQKYLTLMKKRIALGEAKRNKAPNVSDLEMEIDLLQEDFDGIVKTHNTYLAFQKKINGGKPNTHNNDQEFNDLIAHMKSSTMGAIVTNIAHKD